MKKKKTTIPSIIKWVIALILVVMQVYPFFYVFTSSFKSLDDFRQLPPVKMGADKLYQCFYKKPYADLF